MLQTYARISSLNVGDWGRLYLQINPEMCFFISLTGEKDFWYWIVSLQNDAMNFFVCVSFFVVRNLIVCNFAHKIGRSIEQF